MALIRWLLVLIFAPAVGAQPLCSSDGVAPPASVLERFINADCESCWKDARTPRPRANEIAIDWVLPGSQGEDAPLAVVASDDALQRLKSLGRPAPARMDSVRTRVAGPARLRLAQGQTFNDYMGASVEVRGMSAARVWLLLVEELPAGTEGSPVARMLVRKVFRQEWPAAGAARLLEESRPMQVPQGATPSRLRLVGLALEARGVLAAATRTRCAP